MYQGCIPTAREGEGEGEGLRSTRSGVGRVRAEGRWRASNTTIATVARWPVAVACLCEIIIRTNERVRRERSPDTGERELKGQAAVTGTLIDG